LNEAASFDHLQATARSERVPESWDPAVYRERAKAWRDKATVLPEDDQQRAVCVEIAEGYERLALLIEQRAGVPN
jgi:hypothetical protein